MSMIHYNACPVCNSTDIHFVLECIDHTVSKRSFPVWHCNDCSLRFTQDVPDQEAIGDHYRSETYVSHSETKEGIINRLYHIVRKFTLKSKADLVISMSKKEKGSLLDVGAGTGAFAAAMQKKGWEVLGLEPDDIARKNALQENGVSLSPLSALKTLAADQYDAITLWHVLEHVHDLHGYIDTFYSLLKANGVLLIAVPNYTSTDAKTYGKDWAAYDVPRHLYHFSPASMQRLMQQHQFRIMSKKPMWFDSFYVSMLSEQHKHGSSANVSAVMNGLRSNWNAATDVDRCSSIIYCIRKA